MCFIDAICYINHLKTSSRLQDIFALYRGLSYKRSFHHIHIGTPNALEKKEKAPLTRGDAVAPLALYQHGVVLAADPVIRADALLAVALRVVRQVVVLGDELFGLLVVADHDDVGPDHLGPALAARQPERHVLVVPDAARHPDLDVLVAQLPLHLHPAVQQLDAVAQLRRGCAARLRRGLQVFRFDRLVFTFPFFFSA